MGITTFSRECENCLGSCTCVEARPTCSRPPWPRRRVEPSSLKGRGGGFRAGTASPAAVVRRCGEHGGVGAGPGRGFGEVGHHSNPLPLLLGGRGRSGAGRREGAPRTPKPGQVGVECRPRDHLSGVRSTPGTELWRFWGRDGGKTGPRPEVRPESRPSS